MKYIDFEKNVAGFEDGRYEARLDRAKQNVENYMHKNHVHVFDKKKKKEVATINGLARNVTYQDLDLPTKLGELIMPILQSRKEWLMKFQMMIKIIIL